MWGYVGTKSAYSECGIQKTVVILFFSIQECAEWEYSSKFMWKCDMTIAVQVQFISIYFILFPSRE